MWSSGYHGGNQCRDRNRERPSGKPVRPIPKLDEVAMQWRVPTWPQSAGYVSPEPKAHDRSHNQIEPGGEREYS